MTTLFQTAAVATADPTNVPAIIAPSAAKRRGWLPLLTVLFLISYGLMTMLIIEQGATIESQRALIRELFRDSRELSAVKKAQQEKSVADTQRAVQAPSAKPQVPVTQNPSSQTPSTQYPSTQAPTTQIESIPSTQAPVSATPSSQAVQQHRTQSKPEKQKPQFQMPSKPASDLIDDPRNLNVT